MIRNLLIAILVPVGIALLRQVVYEHLAAGMARRRRKQTRSRGTSAMTREEALATLGITDSHPSHEDIDGAWRHLMRGVHPDSGGSALLAQRLNEARHILKNS